MQDRNSTQGTQLVCPICQTELLADNQVHECSSCHTAYHSECWEENQGCAIYGCPNVPPTEGLDALEISASYWGQEKKQCSVCNAEILAAAVRCKSCGTRFKSERPETLQDHQKHTLFAQREPGMRKFIVGIFIFCIISCFAPLAAIIAYVWYSSNKEDIKKLPPVYQGLIKLGILIGFIQLGLMLIFGMLHSMLS